jgi:hypothetical protein
MAGKRERNILIGVGLVGLIGAGLIAPSRARENAETPGYDVLDRLDGGVVVRRYGARLVAETDCPAGDDRDRAFRRLAGYIFGGNRDGGGNSSKIAMTIPVEVGPAATNAPQRMRFFLPAKLTREAAPTPDNPNVRIVEAEPETVAVYRFSGSARGDAAAKMRAKLLDVLAQSPWAPDGDPVLYLYDAPWVPLPLRRNEIAVRVRPR